TPYGNGPCVLNCLPTKQGDPWPTLCPSGMACGDSGFCVTHHPAPYGVCEEQLKLDARLCPVPGSVCEATWGCSPPCPNGVADCPAAPPGGNPAVDCSSGRCHLSCADGETC